MHKLLTVDLIVAYESALRASPLEGFSSKSTLLDNLTNRFHSEAVYFPCSSRECATALYLIICTVHVVSYNSQLMPRLHAARSLTASVHYIQLYAVKERRSTCCIHTAPYNKASVRGVLPNAYAILVSVWNQCHPSNSVYPSSTTYQRSMWKRLSIRPSIHTELKSIVYAVDFVFSADPSFTL
jgi:hypothetical protein